MRQFYIVSKRSIEVFNENVGSLRLFINELQKYRRSILIILKTHESTKNDILRECTN